MSSNKWFVLILTISVFRFSACGVCPNPCTCKWKGGKQTMECMERGLISIPESVNPDTQVIDLSGNNIQILPREIFFRSGLINLQRIYLKNCRIGQIDDIAFHGLTNLIELDLSHNLLTAIPSGTFHDIPFLRDLIISNNPIQKIDTFAFQALHGLVKLDVSNCELQTISPNAFDGIDMLESLKINGNRLTELRLHTVETLSSLTRLHGIELHNNLWHCDCRMRPVKEWLVNNNIPVPISPKCSGGPERVVHKTFAELHADDFACKPEMLPVSRYVEAVKGDNATLTCRANAIPAPVIRWYWNGRLLLNSSGFNGQQRVYISEEGKQEKRSTLVITNAQDVESNDFYCVAENRAGNSEANFTLHVSTNSMGLITLGNGQIAALSAALVVLIIFILIIISILLSKLRRIPFTESKTPGQIEIVTVVNGSAIANGKSIGSPTLAQQETSSFSERIQSDVNFCNPVQKPPRLNELHFPTSHYNGGSSIMPGSCFVSPSSINNPDLINDTKGFENDEMVPVAVATSHETSLGEMERPASGEYSRNVDSLYPSGLWDSDSLRNSVTPNLTGYHYDDKTPIMDGQSVAGSAEELSYRLSQGTNRVVGYPSDYGLPMTSSEKTLKPAAANQIPLPANAKTLRVWQKGGVPVLPPVTALKRVLTHNRNSPDEGYQEGCGTDV
ncbi:unnamed protein product [Brassicogethes aeneus]|uniref:Ig-like domain-containing protein n=1 Tax=Brassicogethes aeneus TaxID=1431903 RepID=A0A9P0BC70_BRAAE|nr:unnamed protein product [Brassicogethes aeneus]